MNIFLVKHVTVGRWIVDRAPVVFIFWTLSEKTLKIISNLSANMLQQRGGIWNLAQNLTSCLKAKFKIPPLCENMLAISTLLCQYFESNTRDFKKTMVFDSTLFESNTIYFENRTGVFESNATDFYNRFCVLN